MRSQLRHLVLVVSVLSVLVALPVKAQVNEDSFETEVPQVAQARVQVTGVRLNSTPEGLEVVLITTGERLPQSFQTSIGETLVIDLINTQLQLPESNRFFQENPTTGIASVEVVQQYTNTVRVRIVGTQEVPTAEVVNIEQGLALNVRTAMAMVEEPVSPPATEPTPSDPTAEEDEDEDIETIELIVTATRTAEEEEDIPRSVTVIDREQIEEQSQLTTDINNILGQTVPGFNPPEFDISAGFSSLRGRNPQILIDGVPITSNFSAAASPFRSIAPGAVEQIEVVRGPTAVFGEGATGGVINIITRRPSEDTFTQTLETRLNSRGDLAEESFGNYLEYGFSGASGAFDYVMNLSTERFGFSFDAEGDRIPGTNIFPQNDRSFNVLGKLGVDITETQRLQFSVNHLDEGGEVEFFNDFSVDDNPDAEKARSIPFDFECIDFDCEEERRTTTLSLNYNHEDILGSQLRLQGFYRRFVENAGEPFEDTFTGDFPGSTLGSFLEIGVETERWGGRLEIETPISESFNLLWGADYSNDEGVQPYTIVEEEDDQVLRATGRVINYTPPYTVESLGLFAQAQWDVTPRWLLSGGVRYDNISASVDDYTAIVFQSDGPIDVEGGRINADDVVFNIGTVYDLTDELSVFASFAQGFGVPEFAQIFRFPPDGFRSLEEDLSFTAPQIVNNYELGIRGQWQAVQFSLAGFFNQSDLGTSFVFDDADAFAANLVRVPERIYGVEATVDWQPSDTWRLGSTISWREGENDVDDDGDFEPLSSFRISPIKLTAYVENETLPGWRNRFQALFVGGRDRAFDPDEGPDFASIESYFVLDYISSIDLGPGSLQIGIQNLLDTQYFPLKSQVNGGRFTSSRIAAPGRTISIGYRVTF